MAASNGNVHEKSWKKALPYLELALPGVRLELSISQLHLSLLLTRKYYSPLSGYLGPLLLQYAETLHHLGRTEEAQESAQVTIPVSDHQVNICYQEAESYMRIIPGTRSHMYSKHYGPRIGALLA